MVLYGMRAAFQKVKDVAALDSRQVERQANKIGKFRKYLTDFI